MYERVCMHWKLFHFFLLQSRSLLENLSYPLTLFPIRYRSLLLILSPWCLQHIFFCFLFHPKAWKIQHPHACRLRNKYLMMRSPHRGSSATIMATTRWKNLAIHGTSLYLEHGPGLDPSFSPHRRQICFTTSGDSVGSYAISSSYEGK